ncbi:MAG: universal stress protein [Hyphomonadaceae bacterium]|nr:universal stress protein [Hyphomonadaceae bacterium]
MIYKDIIAPVISLAEDEAALVAAGELASLFGTRATALIVAVHLASSYADEPHTLSEVLEDIAAGSRSAAARERQRLVDWLQKRPHDFEVRDVQVEGAVYQGHAEAHVRVADLVVMARAEAHQRARQALIERVLFRAGRPLLLTPAAPVRERRWERFVIGWNAKAEAMRAVSAALPLLQRAQEVIVATVDAKPNEAGHGEAPGHELAHHLAKHDVQVSVRNLDSMGREVEDALLAEVAAIGADALVLGAYGHSRAQEFLFGGVTRALLAEAPVPLLLSH